jgi:hypothetical protein
MGGAMTLNSDMPWPSVEDARSRILDIQKKLYRWTKADSLKRFDDLFNLVCDRATHIEHRHGVTRFLEELVSP